MRYRFSFAALALVVLGLALTIAPIGRADVAIAGFAALWAGLVTFMRPSGPTIRYWATLMTALGVWFGVAAASGSLTQWTGSATVATALPTAETTITGSDLRADVRVVGPQVVVSNRSQRAWQEISVELTGDADPSMMFVAHLDRLAAGRTITLAASRFTTPDGRAFDMATSRPRTLLVTATVGEGEIGTHRLTWH